MRVYLITQPTHNVTLGNGNKINDINVITAETSLFTDVLDVSCDTKAR